MLPDLDVRQAEVRITSFIRDQFAKANKETAVVGVSGGVDSATVLALTVKALGPERVHAMILPSSATPPKDVEDAKELVASFGVKSWELIVIDPILDSFERTLGRMSKVAKGNTMARIRMASLYVRAYELKGLVVGTGDKSELLLGYFTKYGDGGVDLLPIGDLYKTWVRQLALHLGVPEEIAMKPSSPRLWPGHLAEEEIGLSYRKVDEILYSLVDLGMTPDEILEKKVASLEELEKVIGMMKTNMHKLLPPPIPKVSKVTVYEALERLSKVVNNFP
ncbi:NAD+ synthetase [Ignicoccus islandicus DSM 13165]|uniref:NH(3)-dependent NAD(+) synthetase n=1 Tax=Ignicoccus islandicus DSM 13165 TaxID=940295 RepID=A0A0U3E1N7_9CREN|nr:NAD+ synthase [Ignicoccus islandicus]ALU11835.1 NAD+ synthetase [Ignicoccus islandicus DSM 13165]